MQVNDYVIYNMEGICRITDIVYPDFVKDKNREYFVLIPVENKSTEVYVPVDVADQRCRKLITEEEANELIATIDEIEMADIINDKEREQVYRSVLEEGDLKKVVAVLKNIHDRRQRRAQSGKKITVVDDKYYKLAVRNLCHELGIVLHLSEDEVKNKLLNA